MERKITNCHTHIFTGDHVPPYLGKTLMPFPLYYFVNIKLLIKIVRSANNGTLSKIYYGIKRPLSRFAYWWQSNTEHTTITKILSQIIKFVITFICFVFIASFLLRFFEKGFINRMLTNFIETSLAKKIVAIHVVYKIIFFILGYLLVRWVRNITRVLLNYTLSFLKDIIGPGSRALMKRYYNIALLSKDKTQEAIFRILKNSYPADSKFIVLPMDLDFVGAGDAPQDYLIQLEELIRIKENETYSNFIEPFVFADPRRIESQPEYYAKIIQCLDEKNFAGIKIYPALGYYPFDKNLLKLFFHACKNGIPIITHCIRGIIFYRGLKLKEWDEHPIFTERENGIELPMKLKEFKNIDFINNFTHPLNYLGLLDPEFLKVVLFKLTPEEPLTIELYEVYAFQKGVNPETSFLGNDLRKLKLCFGHFGGEDEWERYITSDRSVYGNKFMLKPDYFEIFKNPTLCKSWYNESWYSIIRSIIMNDDYPNVYADISFILYDEKIISLLKNSLNVPRLQDKILYGSDFYVVRQKGTDKKFWLDILAHLDSRMIQRIAVDNPNNFLA